MRKRFASAKPWSLVPQVRNPWFRRQGPGVWLPPTQAAHSTREASRMTLVHSFTHLFLAEDTAPSNLLACSYTSTIPKPPQLPCLGLRDLWGSFLNRPSQTRLLESVMPLLSLFGPRPCLPPRFPPGSLAGTLDHFLPLLPDPNSCMTDALEGQPTTRIFTPPLYMV